MTTNSYPFETKKSIKARLDSDPTYRCEAMVIVHNAKSNRAEGTVGGFMSSHMAKGTKVAQKIISGDNLTTEDWEVINRVAPMYSKQLATFSRAQAIANNPALLATAKLFSADNLPEVAPVSNPVETADFFTMEMIDSFFDDTPVEATGT